MFDETMIFPRFSYTSNFKPFFSSTRFGMAKINLSLRKKNISDMKMA